MNYWIRWMVIFCMCALCFVHFHVNRCQSLQFMDCKCEVQFIKLYHKTTLLMNSHQTTSIFIAFLIRTKKNKRLLMIKNQLVEKRLCRVYGAEVMKRGVNILHYMYCGTVTIGFFFSSSRIGYNPKYTYYKPIVLYIRSNIK